MSQAWACAAANIRRYLYMSNKSLALLGSFNSQANPAWDGDKGRLMGSTAFLASIHGITVDEVEAHRNSMPLETVKSGAKAGQQVKPSLAKACKALVIASGVDEAAIKAAYKEYDSHRNSALTDMRKINGMLATDPTLRQNVRVSKNRKGEVIGAVTTYRRDRSASNKDAVIAELQAKLGQLTKQFAALLPAAPAAGEKAI